MDRFLMIAVVKSSSKSFARRNTLRKTWGAV